MHVQSCCFALSSYCLFDFLVPVASLYSYYLRYIVMSQKQNILGTTGIAPRDSSLVPLFLVRKVEIKVSLTRTSLVNEPGKCGGTIAVVYELTKRTREKLFADWAQ